MRVVTIEAMNHCLDPISFFITDIVPAQGTNNIRTVKNESAEAWLMTRGRTVRSPSSPTP